MVTKALDLTTKYFKKMTVKGTTVLHMVHLLNVHTLLAERNCDEKKLAAALLHDITIYSSVKMEDVETDFGKEIADTVKGAIMATNPWEQKIFSCDIQQKNAVNFIIEEATYDQLLIILADKTDNIQSLNTGFSLYGDNIWKPSAASKEIQQAFYQGILGAFKSRRFHPLKAYSELLAMFETGVQSLSKN